MATDGSSGDAEQVAANSLAEPWLSRARSRAIILCAAFVLSLVAGLGSIGIWGAREERLAACVADIARNGNWLIPDLWGRSRLEKPPLPYWGSAAAAIVTGRLNEWTLRVPALVAAMLIVAGVYYLGREAGGPPLGLLAALFLLSSLYFVSELRQPSSDLYLTAFSVAALACWWRGRSDESGRFLWWSLAGLSVGLAALCKGPVVLAVIGPPMLAIVTWDRTFALPRSRAAWAGVAIALAVALAWPAAVLISEPTAWEIWFRQQEIKAAHTRSLWRIVGESHFYLLKSAEYLFPWSLLAVGGVRWGFARRSSAVPEVVRFAWWWFFGDLVLFTLFTARKNYYLMPAVPGLAILAAYTARSVTTLASSRVANFASRIAHHGQLLLIAVAGCVVTFVAWTRLEQLRWLGVAAAAAWTLASAVIFVRSFAGPPHLSSYAASCLAVCCTIGVVYTFVLPALDDQLSNRQFAKELSARVPEHAVVYFWGEPNPALWFYLDRELRPVTRLADEATSGAEAFCLAKQRHLELQPDLAPRLEPIVSEQNRDEPDRDVLARLRLPLEAGTRIYVEENPFARHYKQRKDKPGPPSRVARTAGDSREAPQSSGNRSR